MDRQLSKPEAYKVKCPRCGGAMEEHRVRFIAVEAQPPIFVEDTPAFVCKKCGERLYTDATVAALERVKAGAVPARSVVSVESYAFADAIARDAAGSR
jgi:YgiT-type zinc finger domain-containing protein